MDTASTAASAGSARGERGRGWTECALRVWIITLAPGLAAGKAPL